MASIDGYSLWW